MGMGNFICDAKETFLIDVIETTDPRPGEFAWERNVTNLIRDRYNCILTRLCTETSQRVHRYRDRRGQLLFVRTVFLFDSVPRIHKVPWSTTKYQKVTQRQSFTHLRKVSLDKCVQSNLAWRFLCIVCIGTWFNSWLMFSLHNFQD